MAEKFRSITDNDISLLYHQNSDSRFRIKQQIDIFN